jgi:transcriptional regulator with XRE-family HTH domain
MKTIKQQDIAKEAGVIQSMVSQILGGQRRAGWRTARKLAAVIGIPENVFLEGSLEEIKNAISKQAFK